MTLDTASPLKAWPYPRWIAHRGAGTLAPENTLAAFRKGAEYGYRMFECDAQLSADDVVFLIPDPTYVPYTHLTLPTVLPGVLPGASVSL